MFNRCSFRRLVVRWIWAFAVAFHYNGENEKYIQGAWRVDGANGKNSWFLQWAFDNGNFKQTGYPPITQEGKYRVVSNSGDKLTLELYEQKGTFGDETRKIEILINRAESQLTISSTKGFKRIGERQNN